MKYIGESADSKYILRSVRYRSSALSIIMSKNPDVTPFLLFKLKIELGCFQND